jgi:hypothetical protein
VELQSQREELSKVQARLREADMSSESTRVALD